jgi:hypothetical protein
VPWDDELPPSAARFVASSSATDSAERRQVTVMFWDLVGSTALSARMDPEDLRPMLRRLSRRRIARLTADIELLDDAALAYRHQLITSMCRTDTPRNQSGATLRELGTIPTDSPPPEALQRFIDYPAGRQHVA